MYNLTDLGQFGPYAINSSGDVVGTLGLGVNLQQLMLWDGTLHDLGTLGGYAAGGTGINDSGQIVGIFRFPSNYYTDRAFLYSGGAVTDLGTLGGPYAIALGINNAGAIVGASATASGQTHAFLYLNGTMQDLGLIGGAIATDATAINATNEVVGYSNVSGSNLSNIGDAFLWKNGVMTDLGSLGGTGSSANAINDQGQIVGWAYLNGDLTINAFLYSGGVMHDLGTLGVPPGPSSGLAISNALGINDQGQIVGSTTSADGYGPVVGFISQNGVMTDLNSLVDLPPGVTLCGAYAINNSGEIAAQGCTYLYGEENAGDAYLLTPISPIATPEPSAFWLVATVGLTLIALSRRKMFLSCRLGSYGNVRICRDGS
jgi:probable HAF family extracellular repeat protein